MIKTIIYKFFKNLSNNRKKTNRVIVLDTDHCSPFLNTGTTDETFSQSGKEDSFKILKRLTNTYESSGSQLFRTTTRIKSRPDILEESRLGMNFLNIFRVTRILCSFRLLLEGKAGNEIRRQHLRGIKQRRNSRFTFAQNTIINSGKV